jgi:L-alanine-DL-glutamate epimerase-like enolase superfamily enzyme
MKINDLEFSLVEVARRGTAPGVRSLLVRLCTDSGLEGWGEAGLAWRPEELAARRDVLLSVLAGRSIFDIEELHTLEALSHPALRCAVEMACWDLVGRAAGQPLCHLLGGGYRGQVPLAARLTGRHPPRLARLAREMAARGFHAQIVTSSGQAELDAELLPAVRESVGDRVEVRLDAAAQYDLETARNLCATLEHQRLHFMIDPLATRELYPVASLAGQTSVPMAVWRAIAAAADVLALARCGAGAFVVVDMERVGGLAPARACAAVAAAARISALLGGRPALGIATAAMLHLAAATPVFAEANECAYHELHEDVLVEPLQITGGMMTVPQGPGLGVEVDRAKVEKYAVG